MPDVFLDAEAQAGVAGLITAFFHCLDTGAVDAAANMFAADAPMDMGVAGRPAVAGPDGVRGMFSNRPENRAVRHQWSNLHVRSVADTVDAVFLFATYTGAADKVAPATAVTIGDVEILCRQRDTDRVWQFAAMRRTVIFAHQ